MPLQGFYFFSLHISMASYFSSMSIFVPANRLIAPRATQTARFDGFVMYNKPIRHNSYSILAVQRSSRERVYTSLGSGDEAPHYCQYLQLLCQFFIFLKQLIYLLDIIIRLHGQCCFVNRSDNFLFFFQIIRYLCHCFIFLDFLDNQ